MHNLLNRLYYILLTGKTAKLTAVERRLRCLKR
nr:MAG TPA: hypothetical protein [Caudoviricetes sp.]